LNVVAQISDSNLVGLIFFLKDARVPKVKAKYFTVMIADSLYIYAVKAFPVDIGVLISSRCNDPDMGSVNAADHIGEAGLLVETGLYFGFVGVC
jgi:hypothetical protein